MGKLFGWTGLDSLAKGYAGIVQGLPSNAQQTAFMNSQATTHFNVAAFHGYLPSGMNVHLSSPSNSILSVKAVDLLRGNTSVYNQPWFDIANLYSPSLNPAKWASGFVDVFRGAKVHRANNPLVP